MAQDSSNTAPKLPDITYKEIIQACQDGNIEMLNRFVRNQKNLYWLTRPTGVTLKTPIMIAAEGNLGEAVEILLKLDIDFHAEDAEGKTLKDHIPTDRTLSPGLEKLKKIVDGQKAGLPSLDKNGMVDFSEFKLTNIASKTHTIDLHEYCTAVGYDEPFYYATVINFISQNRHNTILLNQPNFENNGLLRSTNFGQSQHVKILIKYLDVNVKNPDYHQYTPLMYATDSSRVDIMTTLLTRADIDYNAVNNKGESALTLAIKQRCIPAMMLLLSLPNIEITKAHLAAVQKLKIPFIIDLFASHEQKKEAAPKTPSPEDKQQTLDQAPEENFQTMSTNLRRTLFYRQSALPPLKNREKFQEIKTLVETIKGIVDEYKQNRKKFSSRRLHTNALDTLYENAKYIADNSSTEKNEAKLKENYLEIVKLLQDQLNTMIDEKLNLKSSVVIDQKVKNETFKLKFLDGNPKQNLASRLIIKTLADVYIKDPEINKLDSLKGLVEESKASASTLSKK